MRCPSASQAGLGLVEMFLGSTCAMVAVLGTVGGLMTGLKVAIDSKDAAVASELSLEIVESFRAQADKGLAAAVREYHGKVVEARNRRIYAQVILDETRFDPPHDLNGDGDCDDHDLDPSAVQAAYVETKVMWGRSNSKTFVTLVNCRRGSSQVPAKPD